MLVLTIKKGSFVQVGEARVYIIGGRGNQFRIAVDAPKEIPVLRGELIEQSGGVRCDSAPETQ